ncbi:hypothetical protein TthAA22_21310 (plasmid) [Thermus thermophilus]|nr:hypothetical protein TthAA22_21310 [Thermus thermophilus]
MAVSFALENLGKAPRAPLGKQDQGPRGGSKEGPEGGKEGRGKGLEGPIPKRPGGGRPATTYLQVRIRQTPSKGFSPSGTMWGGRVLPKTRSA